MAWHDDLQRVTINGRRMIAASFRGVPFFVEESQRTGGRRTVPHEFWGRDEPWVEDGGRQARTFPVEAYVVGDDYVQQRDDLLEVLEEKSGPGELIHPYHGRRSAICSNLTVRETSAEGRIARFAIEFTETPAQPPIPEAVSDPDGLLSLSADDALDATRTEFDDAFDIIGLPGFAIASATAAVEGMSRNVNEVLSPIVSVTEESAKLSAELDIMAATASELVRTPGAVLDSLQGALGVLVETTLATPLSVLYALSAAAEFDFGPEPAGDTPTRDRERENRRHLAAAMRRVLVIEAARLASRGTYETVDDAIATRDQLADQLESEAATAGDTAYPALVKLRSDLLLTVPPEGTFARLVTIERPVPVPSLVLTYQLYGSVDAEDDVVARNRPAHPGFMAGTLEVLSDDQ